MVDAPVSGGVGGAEAGTLTFMVGGSKENFSAAQDVLQHMGQNIVHCGEHGTGISLRSSCHALVCFLLTPRSTLLLLLLLLSLFFTGQIAKLCNNLVLGISMIAVSEGMALGKTLGIDPAVLAGIVNTSSGRCWSSDTYNPCPGVLEVSSLTTVLILYVFVPVMCD